MKHLLLALMLFAGSTSVVYADWDAALEAEEQAKRDAETRKQQEQDRQIQEMMRKNEQAAHAEEMRDKRKNLGKAADGKSDAEVNKLYDAKQAKLQKEATKAAADAKAYIESDQGKAQVKSVTGKSMEEMQNMSDEDLDALSKKLEKQYGN